eukprot:COSAG01_NODE_1244_length_11080_cov_16.595338_9_plen_54_part_00
MAVLECGLGVIDILSPTFYDRMFLMLDKSLNCMVPIRSIRHLTLTSAHCFLVF